MEKLKHEDLKISIIIPCYNVAHFIERTVSSVFNRKNDVNLEVIIIDDCSKDNSWEVINRLNHTEIKAFRNPQNRGVSFTRNFGISIATGDIIMFLDGDDEYSGNIFEELRKVFSENQSVDFISFGFEIIEGANSKKIVSSEFDNHTFKRDDFLTLFFRRNIRQCMCSFAVRRNILKDNEINFDVNTFAGEDQEVQINCMLSSRYIHYIGEIFFVYKMQSESFMKSKFSEKRITSMDVFKRLESNEEILKLSETLKRSFYTYFALEYFSLLKHGSYSNNMSLIEKVLVHKSILDNKLDLPNNSQAIKVRLLSLWHRISLRSLIFFLKKT